MACFSAADIMLPHENADKFAVIACDQFTSQPEYWERLRETIGDYPSALSMILPEAELAHAEGKISRIHAEMERIAPKLKTYPNSYVYVERTLSNGQVRRGIVGKIDLECYDYRAEARTSIRATEKTVLERIPPRMRVRKGAVLDLSHVLLLCNDPERILIEPFSAVKNALPKLYEFDLLEDGGHIAGWQITGAQAQALDARLQEYAQNCAKQQETTEEEALLFAVGDGNHSLATAKECYEQAKQADPENAVKSPLRYALVELENLQDDALVFEPIHRIVSGCNPRRMLEALLPYCANGGHEVRWISGSESGVICLDRARGVLPVAILQQFLDEYLKGNPGTLDYIHDDDVLLSLAAQNGAIGFLLPSMDKGDLFCGVAKDGVLPRKTFSMGHAREKRYYLECRSLV